MSIQRSAAAPRVANSRYALVSLPRLPRKRLAGAEALEEIAFARPHDGPAAPTGGGTGPAATHESPIQRKCNGGCSSSVAGILK